MTNLDHATSGDRLLPLWFGFLGPPLIWAARFGANYALLPYVCGRDAAPLLQIITVVALLAMGSAAMVAWRSWRAAGKSRQVEFGGAASRARFLALAGLLSSGIFFTAIVAEGIALFFIHPCQSGGTAL